MENKKYIKPETEILEVKTETLLLDLSGIDPNDSGGNILGDLEEGETPPPPGAKQHTSIWDSWDDDE